MTQEQLAEKLYVSRTAVSKWESGKGYPNIESLKCIADVFGITIDELLSGEELISVAEKENNANLKKVYTAIFGTLDMAVILLTVLPLYWNSDLGYSVNLFAFANASIGVYSIYWIIFAALTLAGVFELCFARIGKENGVKRVEQLSLVMGIIATLFFSAAKEPYVVAFMFLLFIAKVFLLIKQRNIR